jgi:S-adenosylmethionine synthetase
MFGYACDESPTYMPLCHHLAFDLVRLIEQDIAAKRCGAAWDSLFLPDAKTQVTMRYAATGMPVAVETLVVSVCHKPVPIEELRAYVHEHVIAPLQARYPQWFDAHTSYLINPADVWLQGGPQTDTGLTGRKIVVDNYGGDCPVGGGAFSGKDPTKVDRSAAYMARYVAKNLVASGLAERAEVQLAYAIGVSAPVSVRVDTEGTGKLPDERLCELVRQSFPLTPSGIIKHLDLRRPIYRKTASGGHFGRSEPEFTWEKTDRAADLAKAAK